MKQAATSAVIQIPSAIQMYLFFTTRLTKIFSPGSRMLNTCKKINATFDSPNYAGKKKVATAF